ncbi:MAG: hypothetical protein ACRDQU_08140 [Pseudonocardiaceae bacterium]
MTAQQLAAAMAANGVKWDRATVAKLESGHRQSISLEEWLTLAYVLNVAPLHLLVPLENDVPYSVSPRITAPSERVRSWVAAHSPSLHAPTSDGHPGDANWLEWMEETPESGMERLLSPRELEAQVARLVEDRIAEVLARIDTSTGQDGDAR